MASDIVTLKDHDLRSLIEQLSESRAAVAELVEAGKFLLDRLVDHEVRMTSDADAREWNGHVTPAMARFRSLLSRHQAGLGKGEGANG